MTQDAFSKDEMQYDQLAQEALRGVVKSALRRAAEEGLPGAHHFYVTFRVRARGVSIPQELAAKYPDEMTIVLQHRFWDLAPGETFFSVTLEFGGVPKKLSIPYAAVTRFYDPSVQFLLQFEPVEDDEEPAAETTPAAEASEAPASDTPKVVSLDTFRKK